MSTVSHSVRVAVFDIQTNPPKILFVHQLPRRGLPQKNGKIHRETERYGLPGGHMEKYDESFLMSAIRELHQETGLLLDVRSFSENFAIHLTVRKSHREHCDEYQEHYYFALLPQKHRFGEIREKEEIAEINWFSLDEIPLPTDAIPFSRNQTRGLYALIQHIATKVPQAAPWVTIMEKRTYEYLQLQVA